MSSRLLTLLDGPPPIPRLRRRLAVALGSTAIALGCCAVLAPLFGETGAYLPLIAALAASVWYGGVGVGLLAQVCGATATFLFIARPQPLGSVRDVDVYGLLAFLVFGNMLSFLTANLRWNARLRQNKRDLQMIAHATHDSLWEWDLATNKIHRDGNVWRIFGGSKSENPADLDAWRRRLHPDDAGRVWDSIREVIETGRTHWEQEYRVRRCDGTYIDVSDRGMVVRDKAGKAVRMIGGVADVSAQKRAEEKLIYNASHDLLTGLPNRELFLARVRAAVAARQQRTDQVMAVLFLDIDRFKVVNDSLGHALGDQLLSAVASRLKQCLPSGTGDIAARFGGDEFTVLLDGVESISAAVRTAEQIQNLLSMPIELENHHIVITVSIGIAAARPDDAPEDVLRHADIAMYRAKAGGKARHAIFEPVIDTPAKDLLQLETDLRQSLRQQRFHLHYQPIVSLLTGQIASFEALLRWEHPRRGLLLPTDFLFIAEEAGLAVPLGQWILREAFQALARWQRSIPAARYVNMNINLSERQFLQPLIVDQIKHGLEEYGVDGRFITLELTETMMIENSELALNRIHQLRELGIKLAIDDFGKGYSSLGRLQELPVSILKIDGSFTRQIEAGKPQIVDAIIALAHQLALEVTAEGVETSWQCAHLARAGCTTGQGFFFAPALEQAAVQALLQREPLWTTTTPHAVPQVRFATNSLQ